MLHWFRQRTPSHTSEDRPVPPRPGLLRIHSAEQLLATEHRQVLQRQIQGQLSLPVDHQTEYVDNALHRYAAFVQLLPASEVHHHAGLGGLLDHTMEVTLKALQLRRGYVLPPDAEPERIAHEADTWSYATFTAALIHDLGKPVVDQEVRLYNAEGRLLGPWEPWHGAMTERTGTAWYSTRYRQHRRHKFHEPVALLVAHWVIPADGLAWIARLPDLFGHWLPAIQGDLENAGPLGQIVLQADRESVARNLGGQSPERLPTPRKPLHEKLMTALRYLLSEQVLPLNSNGAAGWLVGDELWLVSKRTADSLRTQLRDEGHTDIPASNDRIFDTLQERGLLMANGNRAIWTATVSGDGWSHKLTLIRIDATRVWPEPDARPASFEGEIIPLDEPDQTPPAPTQTDEPTPAEDEAASADVAATADEETTDTEGASSLPLPPGIDLPKAETAATNPGSANGPEEGADEEADLELPADNGDAFLQWLRCGITDGEIAVNTPDARVHVVDDGVLLVSPGIFRDFGQATQRNWSNTQKRFLKQRHHRKNPTDGTNIHHFIAERDRRSGYVKGVLIPDIEVIFGAWRPRPNRYLRPASTA